MRSGFELTSRTLVALLLACEGVLELRLVKEIRGYCLRNGYFDLLPHVGTALVGFYLNLEVRVSSLVFDLMVMISEMSWNAMITGYFASGDLVKALELFVRMLEDGAKIDLVTVMVVIQHMQNLDISNWGCKYIKWLSSLAIIMICS
jgi:pentatricopeptide repeat protein